MASIIVKRRSERLRKRKHTLFKKAYELGKDYDVDIAVIIYQYGKYYIFKSTEKASWPPSMAEIVSIRVRCHCCYKR